MSVSDWQLKTPVSAVVFDCDGTLSSIEGIDELAKMKGTVATVKALTEEAMGKTGITPEIYQKRLDLVLPNKTEILSLGHMYYQHKVPDIEAVIQILSRLHKSIYIVSAGFFQSVALFAELLHVPVEHVFAVRILFDEKGEFINYDHNSPLVSNNGKAKIIAELKKHHAEIAYIGDGLNDLVVYDDVTRFVGYGGTVYRKNIADQCKYYIETKSIAPLLPLILTADEYTHLQQNEKLLYEEGLSTMTT